MRPRTFKWITKAAMFRLTIALLGLGLLTYTMYRNWLQMPGTPFRGELPPPTTEEQALAETLRRHVTQLAGDIGERNYLNPSAMEEAARYIEQAFSSSGYETASPPFEASGRTFRNIEATIRGSDPSDAALVVGAHYDTVMGSPGADDNAGGVAALLTLAARFAQAEPGHTIRFVAFANEEPPFFQSDTMGSRVYARRCKDRGDKLIGMISLEMLGYYTTETGSQSYPFPLSLFYPKTGDFIGFVGNTASKPLVHSVIRTFRKTTSFPSEGAALPSGFPGANLSDHWSFWQEDYPALMVTDTAFFRYDHYHEPTDTPDRLDYPRMARVVTGLAQVIASLAEASPDPSGSDE